jgi:hypothetical protein
MVTFGPDHPVWGGERLTLDADRHFFRLDPPPAVAPETIAALVTKLRSAGAAAVKVLPRVADKPVAEAAHAAPTSATARQVVAELVAASRVVDRPALEALIEAALSEAGL